MLRRLVARPRRGTSIIEVVVAMVVGGVVLALISTIAVRQQRLFSDVTGSIALDGQLREAAAILPIDLRGVSVASHDIREARDTSIELRGTIAGAVVCDTIADGLVLAPSTAGATTYASFLTSAEVGDTVWVLTPTDSADDWRPFGVGSVGTAAPKQCAASGPQLGDSARVLPRVAIGLSPRPPSTSAMIGLAVRVTRPVRYSLYRASDGAWYLGEKDWSTPAARFNTVQPVSGPFLSAASRGLVFTYLDSAGAAIAAPFADSVAIAAIRLSLSGQTKNVARVLSAAAPPARRIDSAVVTVLLHNRR